MLIGSGPTALVQAVKAARALKAEGIGLSVVNLPWLNRVDPDWLASLAKGRKLLVTLDDHYLEGGQGQKVLAALASGGVSIATLQIGLEGVPPSGSPDEVLARLGLDAAGIAARVKAALG